MSAASRPTVAHAMRAYLANTETFIFNQIRTLTRHRPVVLAHHRRPQTHFPLEEGLIAQERLRPRLRRMDALAYRAARQPLSVSIAVLARYARDQDARLLHFHYLTDARFLLGLQRRTKLPAVASGYGYDVSSFPTDFHGLGRTYLRPLFDRLDLFLAMSEDMRQDMLSLGCPEAKTEVHYYGSDTRRFRHPQRVYDGAGPLTVLCCARLAEAKGQNQVLEALRRIERVNRHEFRVVIVGEGPARAALERQVADYGWQERVTFTGHVPYTSDLLQGHFRQADVFAHPSTTIDGLKEGIPGTIVEAMASGLPVLATYHAGIPAVIESGRDGLLVAERDPDALASALEALLLQPALREKLGRAAATRAASELDVTTRTEVLERIYDRFV